MGNNHWQNQPRASNGQFGSNSNNKNKESIQQRRIALANKAPLLKNVPLLKFTRNNWKSVITTEMNNLEYTLKNNNIFCTYLGKQVVNCNKTHVYSKNGKYRDFQSLKNHASFIPFIIPVLRSGIVDYSQNRIMQNGKTSSEVICRADIKTSNGIERIGVSVIVVHNDDKLTLEMISVFKIRDDNRLIKSNARKAPKGMADLTPYANPQSASAFNNSSLTESPKKSSDKNSYVFNL